MKFAPLWLAPCAARRSHSSQLRAALFTASLTFLVGSGLAQTSLQMPDVLPEAEKAYGPIQITLSSANSGASILYTLETASGISPQQTYTEPFTIAETTTLRALARRSGFTDSATLEKTYQIVTTLDIWGLAAGAGFGDSPENYTQAKTYGNGAIALRTDGTIVHLPSGSTPAPPSELENVFAIEAGTDFSLAMRDDGSVVAWGDDPYDYGKTAVPSGLPPAVSIAAGDTSASILTTDGRVRSWGGSASNWNNRAPREIANVVAVSEGENYALGILSDGTLTAWRNGEFTHLANIPLGLSNVIAVVAGNDHNLALKADGTVVAWGGYDANRVSTVSTWRNIVAIGASYNQSHGLTKDGKILTYAPDSSPQPDSKLDQVVAFDTQHYSGVALRMSPLDSLSLDLDWDAARGHVSSSLRKSLFKPNEPVQLLAIPDEGYGFSHWTGDISSTQNPLNLRIAQNTSVEAVFLPRLNTPTSDYDDNQPGFEQKTVELSSADAFAQLRYTLDGARPTEDSPLYSEAIHLSQSGLLRARSFAEGYAPSMELVIPIDIVNVLTYGNGALAELPTDATNVVSIASSHANAIALRSDGTIASWTYEDDSRTAFEEAITDVVAVAAGWARNVILHSDGTVYSWETSLERVFPTPEGLDQVIAIAATYDSVLALRADGSLMQWSGWIPTIRFTPDTTGQAVAIACGDEHSVALLKDGSVIEWDSNGLRETPENLPAFKTIAAGREFTVGLTHSGRLISWGRDALQNLRQLPTVSHVIAKGFQAFAILEDGSIRVLAGSPSSGSEQIGELEGISSLFVGESTNYVILSQPGVKFTPRLDFNPTQSPQLEYHVPQGRHYRILVSENLTQWSQPANEPFLKLSLGETETFTLDPESSATFFIFIAP